MTGVLRRGDLRLLLLNILEDGPSHGYELMRALEDRFAGLYRPSAGSVYPRLNSLVAAGLVQRTDRDYELTAAGRAEVEARRAELRDLTSRVGASPRHAAHAVRAEVRAAVAEVRSQQRRVNRGRSRGRRVTVRGDDLAALRIELRVFAADIAAAARRADLDAGGAARVLAVLNDARGKVLAVLAD